MSYAQWIRMEIQSENLELKMSNLVKGWGKFHADGNKDKEIDKSDVLGDGKIPSGESKVISACGRESASSGTDGSFELYDGPTKIGKYYWSCPWGSKPNESTWTAGDEAGNKYKVTITGANLDSGAIGNVSIICNRNV